MRNGRADAATTRKHITDAALAIAAERGAGALTTDAVVERSGVSRGGVMYHFPKRSDLLDAVVQEAARRQHEMLGTSGPSSTAAERTAGYADAVLGVGARDRVALTLALADNPGRLRWWVQPQRQADDVERSAEDTDEIDSFIRRLAIDGLWWSRLLDPQRFSPEQWKALCSAIVGQGSPNTSAEFEVS